MLCMMYKLDRRLIAIEKDKRLITSQKKNTGHPQARAYQVPSCRTERRRMSFSQEEFGTGMCYLQALLKQNHWTL